MASGKITGFFLPETAYVSCSGRPVNVISTNERLIFIDQVLTLEQLPEVHTQLYKARNEWHNIGLNIGIDPDTLSAIKKENNNNQNDCLKEILAVKFKSGGRLTWSDLCNCLRSDTVRRNDVAEAIKKNLKEHVCQSVEMKVNQTRASHESQVTFKTFESIEGLQYESTEIEMEFAKLVANIYQSLVTRAVSKDRLVACLMGINSRLKVFRGPNQSMFRKQRRRFDDPSATVETVWNVLGEYVTFFDYEILEIIVNILGNIEDKENFANYEKKFKAYAKQRLFVDQVSSKSNSSPNKENTLMFVKLDSSYDDCEILNLKRLQKKLCDMFKLEVGVLQLRQVRDGCILLVFEIPDFISDAIFPLSTVQESALHELGVTRLDCEGYHFIAKSQEILQNLDKENISEISIELLKRETKVTDPQLDSRVEEADLHDLASCLDSTKDYIEKLQLSSEQKTDVLRIQTSLNSTQAGMKVALKYWRSRNPMEATFRALLLILLSLLKGDIAVRVCKYLSDKHSTSCPASQERSPLISRLSSYRDYLKYRYGLKETITSTQWPPVQTTQAFKLAMIQKEEIQRGRIDDDFIRLSITGKVDDILQHKIPIEIENLFTECGNKRKFVLIEGAPGSGKSTLALHICQQWAENKLFQDLFTECGNKRKFVLIEGAPGSGKSTLALHICQQWAENKLFQEYDVVVLVRLKDPLIREAKSIEDLLPCRNSRMAEEVGADMTATDGEGVLWVLDGWDELPSDLPSDSIINKLIGTSRESPVLKSDMLVTSRPTSASDLYPLVSSRVEVLGFTPNKLQQYFSECLKGESGAVQTLLERIRENPVVEGSCYLPLNAAIVAHVFLTNDHLLPTSNHGIFTAVVQSTLKRYLLDRMGKTTSIGDITSLDSLPSEIQAPFSHLCRLAFFAIQNNKVAFSDNDLTTLSISKDITELGFLQGVPSIVSDDLQVYFCFLHLSIQELLAAIHISHMSPKEQISVFQDLFGNPRFDAVFQFYAGITKLRTSRPWLSKLPRFLCPVPASVFDLVRKVVKKESSKSLLSLLHCLYEAEDHSLIEFVANLLGHSLKLHYTTLSPLDCLFIGSFLSVVITTVSGRFRVDLTNCSIGDKGGNFLVRGFCKCLITHSQITSQLHLDLGNNDIHEEGIHHIAQLLKNTSVVHSLHLSYNSIGDSGLKSLCEALSTNTTLKVLYLISCELVLHEENASSLCQLLSTNTSLNHLDLSANKITDCHHIAAGLLINKTLKILHLRFCNLNDKSVEDLSTGLNNYIELLNISGNNSITMEGLKILASRLTTLSNLRTLMISKHLESSIETVFSEVNEERRRNELPEITVTTF